jgi:hypothetical protein
VNVDAAIFKQENRMGWEAVVHDDDGKFFLACQEGKESRSSFPRS